MPRWVLVLLIYDIVKLVGVILVATTVIKIETTLPQEFYFPIIIIVGALNVSGVVTLLLRYKASLYLHRISAFLGVLDFPMGVVYAMIYMFKIDKELLSYVRITIR